MRQYKNQAVFRETPPESFGKLKVFVVKLKPFVKNSVLRVFKDLGVPKKVAKKKACIEKCTDNFFSKKEEVLLYGAVS